MSAEEQIESLVIRLSDLKLEFNGVLAHAQDDLRQYVVSRQYPIDDRFEVWAEWCQKMDYDRIIHEADVPLLGKMVDDWEPTCYEPYEKYTWDSFLECLEEDPDLREKYGVTVDDVKELLIQQNFGSFTMDW